jgi:FkbM family methyltransferase
MLSVVRHGVSLRFDDEGLEGTPYVYGPIASDRLYEEAFLDHVRSLSVTGVYVDVGAHLGTHTLWFARLCPSTHVHAFEPVARFADIVRRNVAVNGLQDSVTVHQIGLDERRGRATNTLSSSHQVGFTADPQDVDEEFAVRRLDDVVRGHVALIKIDVEGMEQRVLRGAKRILRRSRPLVYAEAFTPEAAAEIGAVLEPFGYEPTGRVFNATPTYEYAAVGPPRRRWLLR